MNQTQQDPTQAPASAPTPGPTGPASVGGIPDQPFKTVPRQPDWDEIYSRLIAVLYAAAAPPWTVASQPPSGTGPAHRFTPAACVAPAGRDPTTGHRWRALIGFELFDPEARADASRRAAALCGAGLSRVFGIFVHPPRNGFERKLFALPSEPNPATATGVEPATNSEPITNSEPATSSGFATGPATTTNSESTVAPAPDTSSESTTSPAPELKVQRPTWQNRYISVEEWSPTSHTWTVLRPDSEIIDPCFITPVKVRAFIDHEAAESMIARALASKENPVIIELCRASAEQGQQDGWHEGREEGLQEGLRDGWYDGTSSGHLDGLRQGWQEGWHEGWNGGWNQGWNEGLGEGRIEGRRDGYGYGLRAHRRALIGLMAERALPLTPEQAEHIADCDDFERFGVWFSRVLGAASADDILS